MLNRFSNQLLIDKYANFQSPISAPKMVKNGRVVQNAAASNALGKSRKFDGEKMSPSDNDNLFSQ